MADVPLPVMFPATDTLGSGDESIFLDKFPRELRNMVYENISEDVEFSWTWLAYSRSSRHSSHTMTVTSSEAPALSVLLASRQMRAEYMESKVYKNWSATLYIPINHEKDLRAINGTSLSRDPSGTGQGDNPKAITLLSKISNLTVLVDRKFQGSSRRNVYRRGPTSTLLNHILKALPPMPLLRTLRTGIHDQAPIMIHTVHDSESCNIMKNIGDHASAWTTVRGLRLRQVGFGYRNQLDSGYYISDNNGRTSAYMPPLFIVNPIERYSIVRFIGHTYSKGNVKVAQWTPEEMIRVFPVPTPFLRHEFTQEWFEEQARLAGIMKCWFQRPEPGTDESLDTSGRDRYTFYDWPGILQIGSLFVIP